MISYRRLAEALWSAKRNRQEIRPIILDHPDLDTGDAYCILDELVALKQGAEQVPVGYKLGYGLHQSGEAPADGSPRAQLRRVVRNYDDEIGSQPVRVDPPQGGSGDRFCVKKKDVKGPDITSDAVLAATDCVLPALEVVDSRYIDYKFTGADVIADNNSAARVILGERKIDLDTVDLKEVRVSLWRNGQLTKEGVGADVLGHHVGEMYFSVM